MQVRQATRTAELMHQSMRAQTIAADPRNREDLLDTRGFLRIDSQPTFGSHVITVTIAVARIFPV